MPYKDLNKKRLKEFIYYHDNTERVLSNKREARKRIKYHYILVDIKRRCTNSNRDDYKYYGGRGIKCFLTEEEIKFIWDRDNASQMKRPSIDRKNTNGNYELDNCQFIEFSANIAKRNREQKGVKKNGTK
jgi:hypothetical protein